MKYRSKIINVEAWEIARIEAGVLHFYTRPPYALEEGMTARYEPKAGDFLVEVPQDNGSYFYLNPRGVFLKKYEVHS